ncbi:MAG: hypothetical protein RR341_01105, partial [Bacteroidales bacterium]
MQPEELGEFDVYFTVIIWIGMATMLNMRDGVFRYTINSDITTFKTIIQLFLKISLWNAILLFTIAFICYIFNITLAFNPFLLAVFFLSFNLYDVYQQIIRASGKTKLYVAGNLIASVLIALITIVLLRTTSLKANSLIIAYTISKIMAFIITEKIYPIFKNSNIKDVHHPFDKKIAQRIINYSLFLLPGSMA